MSNPAFDLKDRVRQANDIVDLIGSYLPLRRQGSAYVARCPWHDDQRPSLQVNPTRQTWKCWVCNLGGDVFSFVMKRDNVEFRESLRILADRAGILLQERSAPVEPGSVNDKQTLFDALKWSAATFHENLLNSPQAAEARDYLTQRGITPSSVEKFRIGFAPDEHQWLGSRARNTRYDAAILQAIGMLAESGSGSGTYERFRGRILFPIFDLQNRVVGFGGRILPEVARQCVARGMREPAKYINTPETRVFSKSEHLYGLNLVRESTARPSELLVVEGYTDVVAAWQAGLENAVAVLGTALNDRHLRLMKRFVDRVILLLDGDEAGRRRANETLELFVAADLDLRVLTLPDNLDPCDYLEKHSLAQLQQLVAVAADAVDHKMSVELAGIDLQQETHRAAAALENILQTLARRPSSTVRGASLLREHQILGRVARRFAMDESVLQRRVGELRGRVRSMPGEPAAATDSNVRASDLPTLERELLEVLTVDSELVEWAVEQLPSQQIRHAATLSILDVLRRRCFDRQPTDVMSLMTDIEDPVLKSLLAELDESAQAKQPHTEVSPQQRLLDILRAFERRMLEADNQQAIARLQTSPSGDDETDALLDVLERARQRQNLVSPCNPREVTG